MIGKNRITQTEQLYLFDLKKNCMQLKFVQKWIEMEIEGVVRFFNFSNTRVRYIRNVHRFQVLQV